MRRTDPSSFRRREYRSLQFEAFESRQLLAITPTLVADLNPLQASSSPNSLTEINGFVYFAATVGGDRELWRTDGTESGTGLVKDLVQEGSSNPRSLTPVGDKLYFVAQDPTNGNELWRTDGTADGTALVKDIVPGPKPISEVGGPVAGPISLIDVNGMLFFTVDDGSHGVELWKSDGTADGTVLVKDIRAGRLGSEPANFRNLDGTLFFTANDGRNGIELWKSDGTDAGTQLVANIAPGRESSAPTQLTPMDGKVFFAAGNSSLGLELWKSDGTEAGTELVKDIQPGSDSGNPLYLADVQGTLYFRGTNQLGTDLWKTDGTPDGTILVKPNIVFRGGMVGLNGLVYFGAAVDLGTSQNGLWKSDGTEIGTVLVRELPDAWTLNPIRVGDRLFFSPPNELHGQELWVSDGTNLGTEMFEFIEGQGSSNPGPFVESNGKVFFAATHLQSGRELWVLEPPALADDLNKDGVIDVHDLELLCAAVTEGTMNREFIDGFWLRHETGPGDANFDHRFDSRDLVEAFQGGKYESLESATWRNGDWNCDGRFDSADLVKSFERGWYEAESGESPAREDDISVAWFAIDVRKRRAEATPPRD